MRWIMFQGFIQNFRASARAAVPDVLHFLGINVAEMTSAEEPSLFDHYEDANLPSQNFKKICGEVSFKTYGDYLFRVAERDKIMATYIDEANAIVPHAFKRIDYYMNLDRPDETKSPWVCRTLLEIGKYTHAKARAQFGHYTKDVDAGLEIPLWRVSKLSRELMHFAEMRLTRLVLKVDSHGIGSFSAKEKAEIAWYWQIARNPNVSDGVHFRGQAEYLRGVLNIPNWLLHGSFSIEPDGKSKDILEG